MKKYRGKSDAMYWFLGPKKKKKIFVKKIFVNSNELKISILKENLKSKYGKKFSSPIDVDILSIWVDGHTKGIGPFDFSKLMNDPGGKP